MTPGHRRARRTSRGLARTVFALALLLAHLLPQAGALPATAPWSEGPVQGGLPDGAGRHMRVPLAVTLPGIQAAAVDIPVSATVDLAAALAAGGWPLDAESGAPQGFRLEFGSLVLQETDGDGRPVGGRVPIQAFAGALDGTEAYDASLNPVVTVRWILAGSTPAGATRHFFLYFDTAANGAKLPEPPAPDAVARLAASLGPGPATRLYVPLHALAGAQGAAETRSVHVTALWGPTQVSVYEYDARTSTPSAQPIATRQLADAGDTWQYKLGNNGLQASSGRLLVLANRPVMAEAVSGARTTLFLPALDGGLVGTSFLDVTASGSTWTAYCPQHAGTSPCLLRVASSAGTQDLSVAANFHSTLAPAGPGAHRFTVLQGRMALQRTGPAPGPGGGMTAWPALDGPASTTFMGHARPADALLIAAPDLPAGEALVRAQSLTNGNPHLAAGPNRLLHVPAGGLLDEASALGASLWGRAWETGSTHPAGPAILQSTNGVPLLVASGQADSAGALSVLAPLQSPDGGLTYHAAIPADPAGTPLGKLTVFAPFAGTTVQAVRRAAGQASTASIGPLLADETRDLEGAGTWTLQADRPILVAWVKRGTSSFSGLAVGFTDAGSVQVAAAQFAGPALGLDAETRVALARRPSQVEFDVTVANRGRQVDGQAISDVALLDVEAPAGFDDVQVVPSRLMLAPGQSAVAKVRALVLANDPSGAPAATLLVTAASERNPAMSASLPLRINFVVQREVLVSSEGQDIEVRKDVDRGGTTSFDVEVRNTGTVADAYDIELSDPLPDWNVTMTPLFDATHANRTPQLEPQEAVRYSVDVEVPPGGSSTRLSLFLLATSREDRSASDGVRLVSAVVVERSIEVHVEPPSQSAMPGSRAMFNITLTNAADVKDEVEVLVVDVLPEGWAPLNLTREELGAVEGAKRFISLDAGEQVRLQAVREVPAANATGPAGPLAAPFVLAVDLLDLRSTAARDEERLVELRTLVEPQRGLAAELVSAGASADPGQAVAAILRLHSLANVPQQVALAAHLPADGKGWSVARQDGLPLGNLTLAPGQQLDVPLRVLVPDGTAPSNASGVPVVVRATAHGVPAVEARWPIVVHAQPRVGLDDATTFLNPGLDRNASLTIRNIGNVPVDPRLVLGALPSGWIVEAPAAATLGPGVTATLTLRVQVPAGAANGSVVVPIMLQAAVAGRTAEAAANWTLSVGRPVLRAELQTLAPADGRRILEVLLANDGSGAAFDVRATLLDGEGQAVDHVALEQVVPGHQTVVRFVAPAGLAQASLRLEAAHLGEPENRGVTLDATASGPADQPTPAGTGVVVALLLVLLAALRRRP